MHAFGKVICFIVILSLLLSGCTTQCNDIHQRIHPGMSYKEVSNELGKEGEPYTIAETDIQSVVYQWYVDDYTRVIMYFSSADPQNEAVLYKYDITYGCSYFKKGMTYQDLMVRLGSPDSFGTFFHYAGATWKIHDYLFLTVQFEKQGYNTEIYIYPDNYVAYRYDIKTTDETLFG